MAAFLFVVTIPLETDSDPEIAEEEDGEEDARETTDTPKAVKTGEQEGTEASTTDAGTGESQGQNQHGEQDGSVGDQPKVLLGKQDSTECESFTLEEAVQTLLAILEIEKDVWQKSESCGFNQVSFIVETEKVDTVLRRLTLLGIGRIPETSVTLFPAQSHFVGIDNLEVKGPVDSRFVNTLG